MPILIPDSLQIGPRAAGSPSTLTDYLTSIGKAGSFSRFLASSGLAPNSDGSGGAVADGGAVGYWTPIQQAGLNIKFIQATSANRPAYGASRDGTPGVYGNASSWWLALDSTTAMNGAHSLLISGLLPAEAATPYSANITQFALTTITTGAEPILFTNSQLLGNQLPHVWRKEWKSGVSANRVRFGVAVSGTAHNNNAPNILRRSNNTNFSSGTIFEIVLIGAPLTAAELDQAVQYLA